MTEVENLITYLGIQVSPEEIAFLTSETHPCDYSSFPNCSHAQAWVATATDRVQELIVSAHNHEWPFLPPDVQPRWMTVMNEKLEPEFIEERHVVMKSLLLALIEKEYELAMALAFVIDRFMYYYGGTDCILRAVDIIVKERPDIPVPPQLMIRKARLCKDKGYLHQALTILKSFINSPPDQSEASLSWPYKHRYQYDNVNAVCIQIKGQILYNMGLWIDAVHPLMSSINIFETLPEKDLKGMSSSFGLVSKCLRNVMERDAIDNLRKHYPDVFSTSSPFHEAFSCSKKAVKLFPFQALFRSRRFLEGAEALLMATVLDLEADPESQLKDMNRVLKELRKSLQEHEKLDNLESKEEFYEFLKALFLCAVVLVYFPYSTYVPLCWILEELCIALYTFYCHEPPGKIKHTPYSTDLMNAALSLLCIRLFDITYNRVINVMSGPKFWMMNSANQNEPKAESADDDLKDLVLPSEQNANPNGRKRSDGVPTEQCALSNDDKNIKRFNSNLKTVDKSADTVDSENKAGFASINEAHRFASVDFGSEDSYSAVMADLSTSGESETEPYRKPTASLPESPDKPPEMNSKSSVCPNIVRDVGLPVLSVNIPVDLQAMQATADLDYVRQSVGNIQPEPGGTDSEQSTSVKLVSKVDTSVSTDCSAGSMDRLSGHEGSKNQLGMHDEDQSLYSTGTTESSSASSNLYSTYDSLYSKFNSLWTDTSGTPSEFDIDALAQQLRFKDAPKWSVRKDEVFYNAEIPFDYACIQQIAQTNWMNICLKKGAARARLLKYDPVKCIWTSQSTLVYIGAEVNLARKQRGSHRDVYNLSFLHQEEPLGRYVGKRYRCEQKDNRRYLQDVMSQMTARHYVSLFNQRLESLSLSPDTFAQIQYLPVFHLQIVDFLGHTLDYVNAEPYLEGDTAFVKLTNNYDAVSTEHAGIMLDTAVAFSHFTFVQSHRKLMVVDLQGWMPASSQSEVLYLTDPQLHTVDDQQQLSPFDLRGTGIKAFWEKVHPTCNGICKALGIDTLRAREKSE